MRDFKVGDKVVLVKKTLSSHYLKYKEGHICTIGKIVVVGSLNDMWTYHLEEGFGVDSDNIRHATKLEKALK